MNDQHEWRNRSTTGLDLLGIGQSNSGWICMKCTVIVGDVYRPEVYAKIGIIGQKKNLTCSEIQVLRLLNE